MLLDARLGEPHLPGDVVIGKSARYGLEDFQLAAREIRQRSRFVQRLANFRREVRPPFRRVVDGGDEFGVFGAFVGMRTAGSGMTS